MNRKKRYIPIIIGALVVLVATFTDVNCQAGARLPEGWTSHSFKLTEHPETFTGDEEAFGNIFGRTTIEDDSRQGFMMGSKKELKFNVYLPPLGKVRFSYGYGPGLHNFGDEINLTLRSKTADFDEQIGWWEVEPIEEEGTGRWVEAGATIPIDAAGDVELIFKLNGLVKPTSGRAFFLAHPAIVVPDDGGKRKRVIWISIDTLPADHLGCYGYERQTSPNIDAIAQEGTVFERCISECPWTLPSYAAMFTGRYPTITGATTNVRFLPEDETTLAQIISEQDFATFSVYNVPWVGVSSGLDRGFDVSRLYRNQYADVSYEFAREWMLNHADEDCLVFIHLYDPHLPYAPKEDFLDTFDPGYEGRYKYIKENYDGLRMGTNTLTDEEKVHIEALFDEEILSCDSETGDFVGFLKEKGFYDDSLIIINSDHGEEFWEHGGFAHGHQLYDEILHIPLIVRGPKFGKVKRVSRMCGGFDIFPTILEWLEMEVPEEISAVSLFETMKGEVEPEGRMHLSEQLYFGTEQKGVSTDGYRYILHTIDKAEELYDVTDDPEMYKDVTAERRAVSRNFRYFITEYTLNEGIGWHVRMYRTPKGDRLGERYEGKIVAPSGFAEVSPTRIDGDDMLEQVGNELHFSISIPLWADRAFDFRTNDENDEVQFEILTDGDPSAEQYIFLGPDKVPAPSTNFTMSILDPMFGLGLPVFGPQGPMHHGFYLWGTSETLREQTTPEIDDRTREELRSLGYLH
jgi:arylsulfatase A-like enzyme